MKFAYLVIVAIISLVFVANLFAEKRLTDRFVYALMLVPFLLRLFQIK